jgi:hypothetical protein
MVADLRVKLEVYSGNGALQRASTGTPKRDGN